MLRDDYLVIYGSINTASTTQPHAVNLRPLGLPVAGGTQWTLVTPSPWLQRPRAPLGSKLLRPSRGSGPWLHPPGVRTRYLGGKGWWPWAVRADCPAPYGPPRGPSFHTWMVEAARVLACLGPATQGSLQELMENHRMSL